MTTIYYYFLCFRAGLVIFENQNITVSLFYSFTKIPLIYKTNSSLMTPPPKVLLGNRNMVIRGLLPTSSKTLVKVGRPFGCVRCIRTQSRQIRIGKLNPMLRVKRIPRSLHVENLCNNSLKGS